MEISKKFGVLCLILMICGVLSGCSLLGHGGSGKVIYANYNDDDTFCGQIKAAFTAKAQAEGLDVTYLDAKDDGNLQIDQINQAVSDNVSAIVLLAVDGTSIVPSVQKAKEKGIPVVILNRDLKDPTVFGAMSDDREAGRMQGEFMAQNLPRDARIVYLMGESSQSGAVKRWEGFKAACLDKRPDVKLLASVDGGWSKTEGLKALTLWMQMFPKIDGVIAGNDNMALGAIQALNAAGRLQGCLVSGVDATDAGLKAVQSGDMAQTIKQDAKGQGEGAVTLVQGFLKGNPPTEGLSIPFTSITRANIAQYAK